MATGITDIKDQFKLAQSRVGNELLIARKTAVDNLETTIEAWQKV
jgi:hypothetical protein